MQEPPDRKVLEGVPRVGYDTRTCPFAGCVEACLKAMGQAPDYDLIMTISGAAFRRLWNRDDPANVAVCYLNLEPARRAFELYGYALRRAPADRTALIAAVKRSIGRGRPLIGFDCLAGPPEPCVITGYDRGGETLIGWSYFQPDPSRTCENARWPSSCEYGFLEFGDPVKRPADRDLLVSTLHYAIDLERIPRRVERPDHIAGLAAYAAWAAALEVEADYPAANMAVMETRRMIQTDQLAMLHERGSAAAGLRTMAGWAPEAAAALNEAARLYGEVGALAARMPSESIGTDLASPERRRALAGIVREAAALEARAVEQLEKALDTLQPIPDRHDLKVPAPADLVRGARWQIESLPGPIALRALMNVLGDDLGRKVAEWSTDYAYVLFQSATGQAYDVWVPDIHSPGREPSRPQRGSAAEVSEGWRRAMDAARRECALWARPAGALSEAEAEALRVQVADTIGRRGMPVVIAGLLSPESVALITGFDRAGHVLRGWECAGGGPSILFEPEKRREFADWTDRAQVVLLPREPMGYPEDRRVYRQALERAVEHLERTEVGGSDAGQAVYALWGAAFEGPTGSPDGAAHYAELVDPAIWDLATRRHYAREFVDRAAEALPEAAVDLRAAAGEFGAIHDLMWGINRTSGDASRDRPSPRMADPAVRSAIAAIIRKAAAHDAAACKRIEAALAAIRKPGQTGDGGT